MKSSDDSFCVFEAMGSSRSENIKCNRVMIASIYLKRWAVPDPHLLLACMEKLNMPTWYLSPQHIPLALFSDLVEEDMKSEIARALLQNPCCPVQMGKPDRSRVYEDSTLSSFVTGESWLISKLVGIEPTFLYKSASTWGDDHYFV